MNDFAKDCGVVFLVLFALFNVIIHGGRGAYHAYSREACAAFGEVTRREVRFVDPTYWHWWCLTPAPDGKLIPVESLHHEVTP